MKLYKITGYKLVRHYSVAAETVPSYLASAETVCNLLFPAETAVHDTWLPVESVGVNLLPAETLSRKQNYAGILGKRSFFADGCLDKKQAFADSLGGSQIWWTVSARSESRRTSFYPVKLQIN